MKQFFSLLLFCVFARSLSAQDEIVKNGFKPESEFHVAINPNDSNHIVLATMYSNFTSDTFSRLSIYYTTTGGQVWERSDFEGEVSGYMAAGDPVVSFDQNGRVYLTSLTVDLNFVISDLLSWSDDNGATWQTKLMYTDCDKPWFAIDRSPQSPYLGRKYVPMAVFSAFQGSMLCLAIGPDDQTLYQTAPFSINHNFIQLASVDTQQDGDVFVGFYYEDLSSSNGHLGIAHSTNGGQSFGPEVQVATTHAQVFSSIDKVSNNLNIAPYIAIDRSGGPYHNRIYYAYTDVESVATPEIFDIFLTWSDDDGAHWTTPKVVHEATAPGTQQFYSSIFVNETGAVVLGWYDRRNDPSDIDTDFYTAISTDGGHNFQEFRANSVPSNFEAAFIGNDGFGIGDYGQIVATPTTAIPFWADGRSNNGDLNVYYRHLPIGGSVAAPEINTISATIQVESVYPVPADKTVQVRLKTKRAESFKMKIITADGITVQEQPLMEVGAGNPVLSMAVPAVEASLFLSLESASGYRKVCKIK